MFQINEEAEKLKNKGNQNFGHGKYTEAIKQYEVSIFDIMIFTGFL